MFHEPGKVTGRGWAAFMYEVGAGDAIFPPNIGVFGGGDRLKIRVAIDQVPATALSWRLSCKPEVSAAPTTSNMPPNTGVPAFSPQALAASSLT